VESLWCRGREANRVQTKFIADHSLWTIVRYDNLLCSSPMGAEPLDWGISGETSYGRGGTLSDFADNAWSNEYEIHIRRKVSPDHYAALFSASAVSQRPPGDEEPISSSSLIEAAEMKSGNSPFIEAQVLEEEPDLPTSPSSAEQDIMFGERVSIKWNGKRYAKSVLKNHALTTLHQLPTFSLPKSRAINLTLRGHHLTRNNLESLARSLRYVH